MPIFFILVIFAFILYLIIQNNDSHESRKKYVIIMTIILIIIAGIRHEAVGNDTFAYLNSFNTITYISWESIYNNFIISFLDPTESELGKDPGMLVLNKLLSYFISNQQLYLSIMAASIIIPLGMFLIKTCVSLKQLLFAYSFYITFYYSYLPCSAIRQSIATGIILIGYLALIRGNIKKFILLVILAALFHKSSLIVFIFLLAYLTKKPRLLYTCTLLSFTLVLIFYNYLGTLLSNSNEIYATYGNSYFSSGKSKPFLIIILYIIFYLIGLFKINTYKRQNTNHIIEMAMIGTALTTTFIPLVRLDPTLIRITGYFVMWSFLFISESIFRYSRDLKKLILIICLLLFIYRSYFSSTEYAFFWQDMILHERYL